MRGLALNALRRALLALLCAAAGALLTGLALGIWFLESRPDLEVWHRAELDAEFRADAGSAGFADYLAREQRLFAQLQDRVHARIDPEDRRPINRFHRGSLADPARWPVDWNRSFELAAPEPQAAVLLLHGMSDSPYSLRAIGRRVHADGAWVLGLRLPGHGTAPAGLTGVRWEDMAAATRLAVDHLRQRAGDVPLFIIGYSNGAALAVHYALQTLEDGGLPAVDGLVLVSPAIGVSPVAALAAWQARLGRLLGLEKLAWSAIEPEFDPFNYNSFAINAAVQVHRLTGEIERRMAAAAGRGALQRFPPVLAFLSAVDATVSAPAVVERLFLRLPPGDDELVLYDINRSSEVEELLRADPGPRIEGLFARPGLPFALRLVTNESADSTRVVVRTAAWRDRPESVEATGMAWPRDVHSLSHVALPFAVDDPLYGPAGAPDSPGVNLGRLELRGEHGVLQLSPASMLRLRWNPFHAYQQARLRDFMARATRRDGTARRRP